MTESYIYTFYSCISFCLGAGIYLLWTVCDFSLINITDWTSKMPPASWKWERKITFWVIWHCYQFMFYQFENQKRQPGTQVQRYSSQKRALSFPDWHLISFLQERSQGKQKKKKVLVHLKQAPFYWSAQASHASVTLPQWQDPETKAAKWN